MGCCEKSTETCTIGWRWFSGDKCGGGSSLCKITSGPCCCVACSNEKQSEYQHREKIATLPCLWRLPAQWLRDVSSLQRHEEIRRTRQFEASVFVPSVCEHVCQWWWWRWYWLHWWYCWRWGCLDDGQFVDRHSWVAQCGWFGRIRRCFVEFVHFTTGVGSQMVVHPLVNVGTNTQDKHEQGCSSITLYPCPQLQDHCYFVGISWIVHWCSSWCDFGRLSVSNGPYEGHHGWNALLYACWFKRHAHWTWFQRSYLVEFFTHPRWCRTNLLFTTSH